MIKMMVTLLHKKHSLPSLWVVFFLSIVFLFSVNTKTSFAQEYNCANGGKATCENPDIGGRCVGSDCVLGCAKCTEKGGLCRTSGTTETCVFGYLPSSTYVGKESFTQYLQSIGSDDTSLEKLVGGGVTAKTNGQGSMMTSSVNGALCLLLPCPDIDKNGVVTFDKNNPGAILVAGGFMNTIISRPPISSVEYFADLGKSFGIVKPAYAQGIGFVGLQSYLPLWKAFRNMAYILISLVMIYLGVLIMLRAKISPQLTFSVQAAIPRVITGLIFITFSYAIAGLLIDFMYLISALFIRATYTLSSIGTLKDALIQEFRFNNMDINQFAGWFLDQTWKTITGSSPLAVPSLIASVVGPLLCLLVGPAAPLCAGIVVGVTGIGTSIFVLAIGSICLGFMLSTIVMLVRTYLTLIINIVLAPIIILFSILPSKDGGGVSTWIKSIFIGVLVFSVSTILLVLGDILATIAPSWGPPLIGNNIKWVQLSIGLGIMATLPQVETIVKGFVESKGLGISIGGQEMAGISKTIADQAGALTNLTSKPIEGITKLRFPGGGGGGGGGAPAKVAPCFSLDLIVNKLTDGARFAINLSVGDMIETSKGYSPITLLKRHYFNGELCNLFVTGGKLLSVTGLHYIYVQDTDSWVLASEIKVGQHCIVDKNIEQVINVVKENVKRYPILSLNVRDSNDYLANGFLVANQ